MTTYDPNKTTPRAIACTIDVVDLKPINGQEAIEINDPASKSAFQPTG
jgi:hypothetical protein